MRELGAALVVLRLARGLKQCELAGRADTTCGMLCSYESGKQVPHMRTLSRLLEALSFTYAELHRLVYLPTGRLLATLGRLSDSKRLQGARGRAGAGLGPRRRFRAGHGRAHRRELPHPSRLTLTPGDAMRSTADVPAKKKARKPKEDFTQVAFRVFKEAIGEAPPTPPERPLPPRAAAGQKGGLKGGTARAAKLSAEERREIARTTVRLGRWYGTNGRCSLPLFRRGQTARSSRSSTRSTGTCSRFASWPDGDPDRLDADERATVEGVLEFYGPKTSQWLSDLTHNERPWREARGSLGPGERGTAVISLASMHEYYSGLSA